VSTQDWTDDALDPQGCAKQPLAVGAALHTLEPAEDAELADHLPGCADCQQAYRDAELVAVALGGAVAQLSPPPELRDRVLTEAMRALHDAGPAGPPSVPPLPGDEDRGPGHANGRPGRSPGEQRARAASPGSAGYGVRGPGRDRVGQGRPGQRSPRSGRAVSVRMDEAGASVLDLESIVPRRRLDDGSPGMSVRTRVLLAVPMVVLLAVAVVFGVQAATLRAQRDGQAAEVATASRVLAVVGDPGVQRVVLGSENGTTTAVVLSAGTATVVIPNGLAPNRPSDDTYVLWGFTAAGFVGLATFDVSGPVPTGPVLLTPGRAGSFSGYAISVEPGRSLPAMPSRVVARGPVGT
jgi:hypothetical protein